jgi:myo-inositol catabolism protein IolC
MSMNEKTRANRRRCFMVALDHRSSFERDLRRVSADASPRRRAELKTLVWEGVRAALPEIPEGDEVAILIDRGHDRIAAEAAGAGVTVALALEGSGGDVLRPEAPAAELVRDLRAVPGSLGKVLLRWHPDDGASRKEQQLAALHHLADLTERSGRRLLLELLVPPTADDRTAVAAVATWDESRLPRHQAAAVAELLDSGPAGLAPAVWKLEGHTDTAQARQVATAVRSADPGAFVLVLGGGATIADLARPFSGGAGIDAYRGFAVGRSIWRPPILDLCRGETTAQDAREAIARNLLAVIDVFETTAASSA